MKNLQSEMKASVTSMDGMQSAEEATAKKADILARSIEAGKQKVALIQGEYDRAKEKLDQLGNELEQTKKEFGENSEEALKAEQAYNKQAKAVNDLGTKLNNAQADVNKMTHELDTLGDEADDAGDELEEAGKKSSTFGDTLKGVVTGGIIVKGLEAIANAAKRVGREMIEAVKGAVTYADELVTLSNQTGIATDKLQEYKYMSELVDVSVETITGSMKKLTTNMYNANTAGGATANIFKQLGVEITDTNGNLRDNEDVFADVIDALGQMTDETERDAIAMKLFGKSAQELNPLIKAGGDTIAELADEAHRMGYVLDDEALAALVNVSDAFERMKNVSTMLKNQLAVALAPVIERLAQVLTDLIQRIDWDKFAAQVGDLLTFIIDHAKLCAAGLALIAAGFVAVSIAASPIAAIAAAVLLIVAACTAAVIGLKKLGETLEGNTKEIEGWKGNYVRSQEAVAQASVETSAAMGQAFLTLGHNIRETNTEIAQSSIDTSAAMGAAFIGAGEKIRAAFADMKNTGKDMRDSLSETAKILANDFQNMASSVKTAFGNLKDNVSQIVSNIVDKVKSLPAQMLQIGSDMVSGLWQGIKNRAQWLLDQIKAWANSIVQGIKNTFKISSPSKVMEDQVGVMIARGMANGIRDGVPYVQSAVGMLNGAAAGIMAPAFRGVGVSDLERVGSGIVNGMAATGTGGYGGRIEVPLVINGREFARAVLTDFRAVQKASPEVAYG